MKKRMLMSKIKKIEFKESYLNQVFSIESNIWCSNQIIYLVASYQSVRSLTSNPT